VAYNDHDCLFYKLRGNLPRSVVFLCALALNNSQPFRAAQVLAAPSPPLEGARLEKTLNLAGTLYHVQGVELDADHIWVTSVDTNRHKGFLHQFNRASGAFERQVEVTDGIRFHVGGFSIKGNSIWLPVAEYRPNSSAVIQERDKTTLKLKHEFRVADHLGCLAVTPEGLLAGNWGSRRFYLFSRDGRQLKVLQNPEANQYQDIKFQRNHLVASGIFSHTSGAVDWLRWPSLKLDRRLKSGLTDRGVLFTEEGMAAHSNDLYLLPEDGPSRLFHLRLEGK
jgi:hypothetical protein